MKKLVSVVVILILSLSLSVPVLAKTVESRLDTAKVEVEQGLSEYIYRRIVCNRFGLGVCPKYGVLPFGRKPFCIPGDGIVGYRCPRGYCFRDQIESKNDTEGFSRRENGNGNWNENRNRNRDGSCRRNDCIYN